jgi:hypothetical protein
MSDQAKPETFTPGPWTASGNGVHKGIRCVATTHNDDHRHADARLIAAAPELLAALRGLLDLADESGRGHLPMLDAARAALAKAEGRDT